MKKSIAFLAALALAGCKTYMPESDYQNIATVVGISNGCKRENLMTADQFNHLVAFEMNDRPGKYNYDQGKLGAMVESMIAQAEAETITDANRAALELACAQVASAADRLYPKR